MAKLYRFEIEKAVLESLPERELSILLGSGKILNELNIGTKYLTFCINAVHASEDGPDRTAAFTTLSFFLRTLAGHVFEAYEYFRKVVRVDQLQKSRSKLLDDGFYADIKTLRKYFGRTNVVSQMRKRFSFHTDAALMNRCLLSLPPGFTYEVLLGQEHQGNNVFYGSEMTMIHGIQHLGPHTEWDEAIDAVFKDTTEIATLMAKVFQRIIGSIMSEHLGLTMDDAESLMSSEGPAIDTVVIPFFCKPPIGRPNVIDAL
jgi:hypothetical protein